MNNWVAAQSIKGLFTNPPINNSNSTNPWDNLNEDQTVSDQSGTNSQGPHSGNPVQPEQKRKLFPGMSTPVMIGLALIVVIGFFGGLVGHIGEGIGEAWTRPNTVRGVRAAIYNLRLDKTDGPSGFRLRRAELFKAVGQPSSRSLVSGTTIWMWRCVDGVVQVVAIEDDITLVQALNEYSK
jgi:hypothetical protein